MVCFAVLSLQSCLSPRRYRLSADQNNSAAQYSLGVCLYEGIGCARDVSQAIRLLESSRDLGVDQARVALQRIEELAGES